MILRTGGARGRKFDEQEIVQLLETVSNSKPEIKVTFKRRALDFDDLDDEEEEDDEK